MERVEGAELGDSRRERGERSEKEGGLEGRSSKRRENQGETERRNKGRDVDMGGLKSIMMLRECGEEEKTRSIGSNEKGGPEEPEDLESILNRSVCNNNKFGEP